MIHIQQAGSYTTGCLRINDCPCHHSLTEPSKQFYCYSLKKLQLITIFLLQLRDLAITLSTSRRFGILSSEMLNLQFSLGEKKVLHQLWNAFDWTVIGTDFKFSTYFILHEQQIHCILNHVDNWTKQWQAGAAQLPLLGAPCFLLDKSDLFVCIFVNKNWPINIHCRTF